MTSTCSLAEVVSIVASLRITTPMLKTSPDILVSPDLRGVAVMAQGAHWHAMEAHAVGALVYKGKGDKRVYDNFPGMSMLSVIPGKEHSALQLRRLS